MPRVSVCLEMVYDDEPFHERITRAAEAGADAVEFWDWRGKDMDRLDTVAADVDIPIISCVAGGTLTDPNVTDEAVETLRESITMAGDRDIPTLIVTTGPDQEEIPRTTQHETIVETLSRVASDAESAGVTLLLEPLNTAVDHPDYYLASSDEGFEIIDEVDSPNVGLLYDVYHQQITEGNVIQTITANIDRIGHIHVADVPGRNEPGTGELNYENVFAAIDRTEYDGYVGCEFSPVGDADAAMADVLDWR
ncbi:hydroxypyruvate isomerase [Haloarcula mannanilytica]|uniref:Hydroxypyruvate isomerase n=1 Tax=Haloarcula mannanilytica TaxID=2509225 RepID=A0A4C2EMQ7_9EURY|nr:TIM barrel protein [Haloarcula mannanilytica]GCF15854.1 hydroxypyruvate isomerase [Haloarcula mannanilytica]